MSEGQEGLPQASESQTVPVEHTKEKTVPVVVSEAQNCCSPSKEALGEDSTNENDEDNASESDWKPEGSGICHLYNHWFLNTT